MLMFVLFFNVIAQNNYYRYVNCPGLDHLLNSESYEKRKKKLRFYANIN